MNARNFAVILILAALASVYIGESNYYVRKQMTELALAAALGVSISGIVKSGP